MTASSQRLGSVSTLLLKGSYFLHAVLFIDQTNPLRAAHPFAVVTDTKLGKDGRVRSATIRTTDRLIRERDIRKLVLLERSATPEDRNSTSQSDVCDNSEPIAVFAGNRSDDVSKPQSDVCDNFEPIAVFAGNRSDDVSKPQSDAYDNSEPIAVFAGNRSDDVNKPPLIHSTEKQWKNI